MMPLIFRSWNSRLASSRLEDLYATRRFGVASSALTALGRMTVVDDGYRNVAQHFVLIGQRIGRGVDENSSYDDQYDARVVEYMAVFVSQNTRKFPEFGTEPVCLHDHSLPQYFSSVQIFLRRRITVHGSSRKAARPTR